VPWLFETKNPVFVALAAVLQERPAGFQALVVR
jgi:hypothetical protein